VREDGRVRWAIGNSPIDYHNCVVGADLSPEEAGVEITASIERMRTHDVPGTWHVGPSMRPPDLGARLVAHGFEYGGDDIGTATDLSTLPEEVPVPATFAVERVRDRAGLAAWVETLGSGFGKGPVEAEWVGEMCLRLGLDRDGSTCRHYLGRLDGEPVATATLFFGVGVAGVYFVYTVERARRRGIGAAVTLAALRETRDMDIWTSPSAYWAPLRWVTPSTAGSDSSEHCRIGLDEWRPG
jgi:predicted GNAT family acetyltransferase